jgi:hypothetical protein
VIGFLVNPTNPRSELVVQQMEEPARALGLKVHVLNASTEGELDSAFASLLATVAVARKLAVILHRMWMDRTEFNWSKKEVAALAVVAGSLKTSQWRTW